MATNKKAIIQSSLLFIFLLIATTFAFKNVGFSLMFSTLSAFGLYYLLTKNKYAQRIKAYKALHKDYSTYSRGIYLRTYPSDSPICQVCFTPHESFNPNGTHECNMHVSVETVNEPDMKGHVAVMEDMLSTPRWRCSHLHENINDAYKCAATHYYQHTDGECKCAYFPRATAPSTYNNPTSHLYIIRNEKLNAVKIGMSGNKLGVRINEHLDEGWELIAYFDNITWMQSWNAEQTIISNWRTSGIGFGAAFSELPQKGASETAPLYEVDLNKLTQEAEKLTQVKRTLSLEAGK